MFNKNILLSYFIILFVISFGSLSFSQDFGEQNCPRINEPLGSNGYIFNKRCDEAFILAPSNLVANLRYNKKNILRACAVFTEKNITFGFPRIYIHNVYSFNYKKLIDEFRELNSKKIFFHQLRHSFSIAAIPRYETALSLGHFPISVTSLKNTEKVLRTYYNHRQTLEDIDLELDRYSLLPFNNIIQNTWTLDVESTCSNYYDQETQTFDWNDFEEDRLLQLSPIITNEYVYTIINEDKRTERVKVISVSYYKK